MLAWWSWSIRHNWARLDEGKSLRRNHSCSVRSQDGKNQDLRRRGGDDGLLEAGAVGLVGRDGGSAQAGTGDSASAVVSSASHGGGNEREDNGDLHVDGCVGVCGFW